LLSLLYDTGARVQELADMKLEDVRLSSPTVIRLTGKGGKSRLVPIMTPTDKLLRAYLEEHDADYAAHGGYPLFCNRDGKKLTRAGIAYILDKYVNQAQNRGYLTTREPISPHCLRHSKAMHLLQSGVNLVYIRDLLGHADVSTTEVYARADEHFKRKALTQAYPSPTPEPDTSAWQKDSDLLDWLFYRLFFCPANRERWAILSIPQ
jgi:site-specific recombinase XerD